MIFPIRKLHEKKKKKIIHEIPNPPSTQPEPKPKPTTIKKLNQPL